MRAAAIALGGALTALVALHGSPRDALFTAGSVLLASAIAGPLLRRHDSSEAIDAQTLELLRGVPLLGWLPSVALERLASKLEPIHSVPRTATVVAASDLRVLALDRSEFLVAATGAPDSRAAADALVIQRLAQQRA